MQPERKKRALIDYHCCFSAGFLFACSFALLIIIIFFLYRRFLLIGARFRCNYSDVI